MGANDTLDAVRDVLIRAVQARVFPAAVAEVGNSRGVLWREPFGALTFESGAPPTLPDTIFDLASLTKPIATTSIVLRLVADRLLSLEELVGACVPEWTGPGRAETSLEDLLQHASGLPARLIDRPPKTRRELEHDICALPLEYTWRSRSLYSDLGFILLGFVAADRGSADLDVQFDRIVERLSEWDATGAGLLRFGVPSALRHRVAPTDPLSSDARRGRRLQGEVHDDYAAVLGGIAGHAGLFATADSVGTFSRAVLRGARGDPSTPEPFSAPLVARATRRSTIPGSSRALGWDTMLVTSSCGSRLSRAAFGHVGFTGTSLWIDPGLDRYFVLLTNRACGGGTSEEMQGVRRAFHDAAALL
jgi:CubicO group peptidase (beta-lactamase class C family)